jgi:hypothetical protein
MERSPVINKTFIARWTEVELEQSAVLLVRDKCHARKLIRAHILLKSDAGILGPACTDDQIATIFDVSTLTIHRVRQGFDEQGLHAALIRRTSGYHDMLAIGRRDEFSVRQPS